MEVEPESADSDDMQLPNVTEIKQFLKDMNGINKSIWVAVQRQTPHKSEPSTDTEPTPIEVGVPSNDDSFHSLENRMTMVTRKRRTRINLRRNAGGMQLESRSQ